MSNVWFCSDLHFGHKNIQRFRKEVYSEEHNRELITDWWYNKVRMRDTVWVLGDAAFTEEAIDELALLPGKKRLVRGNHDRLPIASYLRCFEEVYGIVSMYGFWLTHAPVHPDELRGKVNVHGHVHYATIPDDRYVNACVENAIKMFDRPLFSLNELRSLVASRKEGWFCQSTAG